MLPIRKFGLTLAILSVLAVGACQGPASSEGDTPLGSPGSHTNDVLITELGSTNIFLSDLKNAGLAKGVLAPGETLNAAHPAFQTLLDDLIDQRLLALEARRRGLDTSLETTRRLALAHERILSAVMVETLLAEKITDTHVRRIFDEQSALRGTETQIRARQIVVETKDGAQALKERAENGEDFTSLARQYSLDNSTRDLGGDLGYFSKNAVNKTIAEIAFATETGAISQPFETPAGWHIIKVQDRRQTPAPKFEDIKPEIISFMSYDEVEKLLKTLRKENNIQLKAKTREETPGEP